jgi:hypothetical protein
VWQSRESRARQEVEEEEEEEEEEERLRHSAAHVRKACYIPNSSLNRGSSRQMPLQLMHLMQLMQLQPAHTCDMTHMRHAHAVLTVCVEVSFSRLFLSSISLDRWQMATAS